MAWGAARDYEGTRSRARSLPSLCRGGHEAADTSFAPSAHTRCVNQGAGIKVPTGDVPVLRAQLQGKPLPYVYGVVTRKDGEPSANARGTLHSDPHSSQVAAERKTGSDGYIESWNVSPGGYLVIGTAAAGGTPIKDSFGTGSPGLRLIMHDW